MNIEKLILFSITVLLCFGCKSKQAITNKDFQFLDANTYQLYGVSKDVKYGYTQGIPIKVGGHEKNEGRLNQRRYLNALLGNNGGKVNFKHVKSCCYKKVKKSDGNVQLTYLDQYEISVEGQKQRFIIFLSMFEEEEKLLAPRSFNFKTKSEIKE